MKRFPASFNMRGITAGGASAFSGGAFDFSATVLRQAAVRFRSRSAPERNFC